MTGNLKRPAPRRSVLKYCMGAIGWICLSRFVHACAHIGWRLAKLSAVILFFLWVVGIPGIWLAGKLQPHIAPYQLTAARITWNPLQGLVIHDFKGFETNLSSKALVSVENCVVRPSYRQLIRGRWLTRHIDINGGTAVFPSKQTSQTNQLEIIGLNNINGRIHFFDEDTSIQVKAVSDKGTLFTISGDIRKPSPLKEEKVARRRWPEQLLRVHNFFYDAPRWLNSTRERIAAASFTSAPQAEIVIHVDPDKPSQFFGTMRYKASAFTCYGQQFDGIGIETGIASGVVRIDKAIIQQGTTRLNLTGYFDAGRNMCEVHAYNDMPPQAVIPFLSASWRNKLQSIGLKLNGAMQAEGWIGPCKLEELPTSWGGWTIIEKATLNGFPIERAFTSFKRTAHNLIFEDGLINGGSGIGKGELNFTINTDYQKRISQVQLDVGLDIKPVESILPRGVRVAIDLFEIAERPVQFNGSFTLPLDYPKGVFVSGSIVGTNGYFRGVPLTGINSFLTYSNLVVKLDPFHVTCATGGITGSLDLDLKNHQYGVDLEITTNPKVIAPMAGTNVAQRFIPYYFTDDILVKAFGMIDAKEDSKTDLSVWFSGRNVGIKLITLDRLSGQAHRGAGGLLVISNILADTCQGTVTGSLTIASEKNNNQFDGDFYVENLSLDELVAKLSHQPTNRYEGWLSGQATLKGIFPDSPGWKHLRGNGNIVITDGRLLQIPIFGGLSVLLSKIFPGLGFSEQNHLEASLAFEDGAVYSDDLKLSGNMISISGRGSYDWSDDVNLYVKVHPFRDGSIASLIRLVTMPISYILEFKATGPRKNPTWRPANLPL